MAEYNRNYDVSGKGSTDKVTRRSDGTVSKVEQYASHRMAPGIHIADGPKTTTNYDKDGNEI